MSDEPSPEDLAVIAAAKSRGCRRCRRVIEPKEKASWKRCGLTPRDIQVTCMTCHEAEEAALAEQRRQRAEADKARRLRSFEHSCARAFVGAAMNGDERGDYWDENIRTAPRGPLHFPSEWTFATFGNAEFRRRVSPVLLRGFEAYDPDKHGSLVACDNTGKGKSALSRGFVWRELERRRARVEAGESVSAEFFAWVSGFELSGARRRSALGDESPLVRYAIDVPLLVLDEVGLEPAGEETFVVLDGRYRRQLPTILTSPLPPAKLMEHVGGGAYRRLLERGVLLDGFSERGKGAVRVVR